MQQISLAADEMEAVQLLGEATRRIGADVGAFVSFVKDDGSHESYRFLLACDPVWCQEYEKQAWYAEDPWLAYALQHTEPIRIEDIVAPSRSQREVARLAEGFGFVSGVVVPAPSSGGLSRIGVLCLGSRSPSHFSDDGYMAFKLVARSLAMELHEWIIGRIKRDLISEANLTGEDLDLLRLERSGLSTKQVASALKSSEGSINSRWQRLNRKLGVPNRRSAATLAAEYDLI